MMCAINRAYLWATRVQGLPRVAVGFMLSATEVAAVKRQNAQTSV